jgi:DNA polymerase/3'-5' exonuclease PolX
MSTGAKLPWAEAASIAEQLVRELEPVAVRVKAVGSVRRRRPEVGDIEILIEPRMITVDLFGTMGPDLEPIRAVARGWRSNGCLAKSGDRYIQVFLESGLGIDLFVCWPPAQWGSLIAIRTGPAELGKHAVTLMRERGLRHQEGHVVDRSGEIIPTPTEEDFFAAAGLPCLAPRLRDTPAAFRALQEGS